MAKFERIGPQVLDHNGMTLNTSIRLSNGARLEIEGGDKGNHFRLKFYNNGIEGGWWVDQQALEELIAELLYINAEVGEYFEEEHPAPAPLEGIPFPEDLA